ncbi:response regulator [Candidatus Poribacteria bacterium]|nr:response regulator [Candidatus Poribacteria bacterium]
MIKSAIKVYSINLYSKAAWIVEALTIIQGFMMDNDEINSILNIMKDGIILLDENHKIEFTNEVVFHMFGNIGDNELLELIQTAENRPECQFIPKKLKNDQKSNLCLDFSGKHYHISKNKYTKKNGLEKNLWLIKDITAEIENHNDLSNAEELKNIGLLTIGIMHEFNNVLTTVIGRTQLMQQLSFDEDDIPFYESGFKAVEDVSVEAIDMIRKAQEFATSVSMNNHEILDLRDITKQVVNNINIYKKEQILENGIEIQITKSEENIPNIIGNKGEIKNALTHIIINAIEAMPSGGIISIDITSDKDYVYISVCDTGIGIPTPIKRKVLKPFFTTKGNERKGIGLTISRSIIKRYGGDIEIENTDPCGTKIKFYLPFIKKKEEKKREQIIGISKKKANILVIDDEQVIRELFYAILTREGHEVTLIGDSREGLEIFREGNFDLVYTDLGMPELSGLEVASAIKEYDSNSVVVMVTGWGGDITDIQTNEGDVDFVISKPFQISQIRDSVAKGMKIREEKCRGTHTFA